MQNYKEEEEDIERLARRLVDRVSEDVIMGDDQREDSVNEQMMDVEWDSKPYTYVAIQMYLQQTLFPIQVRIPVGK